ASRSSFARSFERIGETIASWTDARSSSTRSNAALSLIACSSRSLSSSLSRPPRPIAGGRNAHRSTALRLPPAFPLDGLVDFLAVDAHGARRRDPDDRAVGQAEANPLVRPAT